jgi:hypothetical protein
VKATEAHKREGIIDLILYAIVTEVIPGPGVRSSSRVLALDRLFFLALTALWDNILLAC